MYISCRKIKGALHICWIVGMSSVFTLRKGHDCFMELAYQNPPVQQSIQHASTNALMHMYLKNRLLVCGDLFPPPP